ncbi:MAG: hypothetical protein V4444_02315 [Pseudomonadota bacterium]
MKNQLLALGLIAALAACNKNDHTIVADGPADDANAVASANVILPPSIKISKTYRCADNLIVHVDWLSDGKSATLHADKAAVPTVVTAAEAGQPMVAEGGYSLAGSDTAASVKIGVPGRNAQSCKA